MEEELQDLYSKLKQNSSYTAELKKRFEENLKAMYRYQLSIEIFLPIFKITFLLPFNIFLITNVIFFM